MYSEQNDPKEKGKQEGKVVVQGSFTNSLRKEEKQEGKVVI